MSVKLRPGRRGLDLETVDGFFIRHTDGVKMNNVELSYLGTETRPAIMLDDVQGAELFKVRVRPTPGKKSYVLKSTENFSMNSCKGFADKKFEKLTTVSF